MSDTRLFKSLAAALVWIAAPAPLWIWIILAWSL